MDTPGCSFGNDGGGKKRKAREQGEATAAALHSGELDHGDFSSLKKNNRNERKRQLEKKRRDEVNSGLDKMMELLFEIDPKSRAESRERQMGSHDADPTLTKYNSLHALNRVDLIQRSTELLRTLHYENQDLKKLVGELTQNSGTGNTTTGASNNPAKPAAAVAQLPPRLSTGIDNFPLPTQNPERSESAPVAILNALREERQSLIDKQRSIDASLEMIRSGRLSLPTAGPRREVSLDFAHTSLQRHAAAARREDEIRLAQYASLGMDTPTATATTNNGNNAIHQESAQALANLRKNRDDLLDEASEPSNREDALSALQQAYLNNPNGGNSTSDQEDLLARLRNSQMANREFLMAGSRLGGLDQGAVDNNRFLHQRLVERLAMEARMPESLARSRTLDPALLLQRHRSAGNGGQPQHRMF